MHVSITQPRTVEQALALLAGASTGLGTPNAELIVTEDHLRNGFERRSRKPEWVWVADRADSAGRPLARAAAWGAPDRDAPWIIDLVDLGSEPDRAEIGAALLSRAAHDLQTLGMNPVEQIIFAPSDWRGDPPAALTDLIDASKGAGFEVLVTRRRFRWTPAIDIPGVDTTLRFEPVSSADDPHLIDAYRRTFTGSLDAHTQRSLETTDAQRLAVDEVADMASYAGPVDGWRLAYDDTGALVGLVTGNRGTNVVIGYVGVVPEQRGRGYARHLLAWMTRWQAEQGAEKVIGETDDQNVPMAAAFEAVGYIQESARIDLVHSA